MKRGWGGLLGLLAASLSLLPASAVRAQALAQPPGLIRAIMSVTVAPNGKPIALDALLTRPAAPGRYPLVVLSHGAPRDTAELLTTEPTAYSAVAIAFARRGYAVIVPLRRGYGRSGGPYAEGVGPCNSPPYQAAARASGRDVAETVAFMAHQDYVDPTRVILAGVSAGGFASVAAAAQHPPGVVAVLNFAGGRGSEAPDTVCGEDKLLQTYAELGREIRVPTLWLYAKNDHYFGALARRFFAAFTKAGGTGEFVALPAFGDDGHYQFTTDGMAVWRDPVDAFLRAHQLPTWAKPMAEPVPSVPPPHALSASGRQDFESYLAYSNFEKAFAVGSRGQHSWRTGLRSPEEAARAALDACRKNGPGCEVYAINNALAR